MATGLPVIATRSGGPAHIVAAETGILVEPEDVSGLAGAMTRMVSAPEVFKSDRIRSLAMERYGERVVMQSFDRLFRQIIENQLNHKND